MLGYATYNGHTVRVLDIIIDRNRPDESCAMIHYSTDTSLVAWVSLNYLTNLQLISKGA